MGADLVEDAAAVPGNRNHCMLKLNTAGCNLLGVDSVTIVSRVVADASAVFGCSPSHRRICAQDVEAKFIAASMHQWIFVFEDDACFPFAASDVRVLISAPLESVGQYYDVIWFGATKPNFESGEHVYHRRGDATFRVRAVSSTYGRFAYAIRKTCLQVVARDWALDGIVMAADGALRKSLRILRGGCCDPALAVHRAPCESGGSRIHYA